MKMDIANERTEGHGFQDLKMWRCLNCEAIHFSLGSVTMNFSLAQFCQLTRGAMSMFVDAFGAENFHALASEVVGEPGDRILLSETVI